MKRRIFKSKAARLMLVMMTGAILMASQMMSAFADQGTNSSGAVVSDNETSVTAAITKVLETGETTTTPNATFKFKFVQQSGSVESVSDKFPKFDEPINLSDVAVPIKDVEITLNGETGSVVGNKKIVEKESGNFLAKAADNANYTRAGIYKYLVTEESGTYTITDPKREKMSYSTAEYELYVYVANKSDGSGVYIKGVGVVLSKEDTLNVDGTVEEGDKVDPTPNPGTTTGGEVSADNSEMKFHNTYLKTPGGGDDPTDPANQTLGISKTVAGDMGDQNRYFDFRVMLKKPLVDTATTVYNGYVVDANNNIVTSADNVADASLLADDSNSKKYIKFTLGSDGSISNSIKLKHGQKLVFSDVAVGTRFSATETAVTNYTPSLELKINDAVVSDSDKTDVATGNRIVGEKKNTAAYTNTYKDVTPTGIIMDNMPLILAVALAAALIFGLRSARRIKKAER